MSQENASKAQPPLVDNLLQYGKLAYDPDQTEATRQENQQKLKEILDSTGTFALIPALNLLVQPSRVQPWLRGPLIQTLALLPLRPRGVQHTIEFILSVHPSSANTPSGTGKGASISLEALNAASKLLSTPPAAMPPDRWFNGISSQLLHLLSGNGEPGMDKAAAYIIGFGILGRRQFGAPGTAGWNAFVAPILDAISPTDKLENQASDINASDTEIIEVGKAKVLVGSKRLAEALACLTSLTTSHPHPTLTKRLLRPILLSLWSLSSWLQPNPDQKKTFCEPARNLLCTFLQLSSSGSGTTSPSQQTPFSEILQNLMFQGRSAPNDLCWSLCSDLGGGIEIVEGPPTSNGSSQDGLSLEAITYKAESFVKLLQDSTSTTQISQIFLTLCNKWLVDSRQLQTPAVLVHDTNDAIGAHAERQLIEAKVMQSMMDQVPDKLVEDSKQVLVLVGKILGVFSASGSSEDEDSASVALSLLNIVLTSPSYHSDKEDDDVLEKIAVDLQIISAKTTVDIATTARNLMMLIKFRHSLQDPEAQAPVPASDQHAEDRKAYKLAMSYLTSAESPPPVRVQGLDIISKLVDANSPVVDVPSLLILYASLLQDEEEYIYLRAIKAVTQLSLRHPKSVMRDLIERYVDASEYLQLDSRLRIGESLLQVIQTSRSSFTGDVAKFVTQGLMSVAGRRGRRPKTEVEQEKQARVKRKRDNEAEEAWGGPVPQLDEVLGADLSPEDSQLLSHIVTGWESKRGAEDIRIRASALSILGSAIEWNAGGIGSAIVATAIDLCIHILTLEPEPEKGILRRSAILLILSLASALESARAEGRNLGFGFVGQSLEDVLRILGYVQSTDNDGLVRQHAQDVVESLQAWQMNSLLPNPSTQTNLGDLAGLSIRPGNAAGQPRPRIEEIE
ncbi:hypothetical protein BP6252_09646 [Coleophoma cylindrospora]|uniref:RNA polymerase II assembly factor Rtp1 C-terminal domain-containing protein n=1 Tax=Coleophoma cylindrospora TaxID=1849047 RepID=A0A3D8QWE1_9HELO|nr:hypothetical protein BP6252_09646 [Coleophoma cylindrospora]